MRPEDKAMERAEFNQFVEAVDQCFQRIGNQRLALDVSKLKAVIKASPRQATRYVEVNCMAAYAQSTLIKTPYIVAIILDREHSTPDPLALVMKTAEEIGATDLLSQIPVAREVGHFRSDGPEREAARKWWDSVDLDSTSCDRCVKRLQRGEGFSVPPSAGTGEGFDLVCQSCFDLYLSEAHGTL